MKKRLLNSRKTETKGPELMLQVQRRPSLVETMSHHSVSRRGSTSGNPSLFVRNEDEKLGLKQFVANRLTKRGSNTDVLQGVNLETQKCMTSFRAHTKAVSSLA